MATSWTQALPHLNLYLQFDGLQPCALLFLFSRPWCLVSSNWGVPFMVTFEIPLDVLTFSFIPSAMNVSSTWGFGYSVFLQRHFNAGSSQNRWCCGSCRACDWNDWCGNPEREYYDRKRSCNLIGFKAQC